LHANKELPNLGMKVSRSRGHADMKGKCR